MSISAVIPMLDEGPHVRRCLSAVWEALIAVTDDSRSSLPTTEARTTRASEFSSAVPPIRGSTCYERFRKPVSRHTPGASERR